MHIPSFIRLYEFRYGDYGIPAGSAQVHRSSPRRSDVAARTCGFPILGRPPHALAHAHSQTPPPAAACQVAAPVPAFAGRGFDRDLDSIVLRTLRPAAPADRRVVVDGGLTPEEIEANCNLIAAAPRLLEALIALEAVVQDGAIDTQAGAKALEQARNAIHFAFGQYEE